MTAATIGTAEAVRREFLTELAREWDPRLRPYGPLRQWADPGLDPGHAGCMCGRCLICLWASFRWDLSLLDGLNDEAWATPVHWSQIDEDYAFLGDPHAAAVEDVEMRVAAGLDALTGGRV